MKTFAQKIDPILQDLHDTFLEQAQKPDSKDPKYTGESLHAVTFIFADVVMSHMYGRQSIQDMDMDERCDEAEACGKAIRELIEKYTGYDARGFYS